MFGDGHPAELRRDPLVVVEVVVRAYRGLQITGPAPSDAVDISFLIHPKKPSQAALSPLPVVVSAVRMDHEGRACTSLPQRLALGGIER